VNNLDNELKTGTTTLGIVCKDCVILAADTRATAGNLIVDSVIDKVIPVSDNMAVTTAGSVSTIQVLMQYLKSELNTMKIRNGREVTAHEGVNLLRNWVYTVIRQPSMVQEIAHFLFAGVDHYGLHLYDIFPDGSLMKLDSYKSSGSGSMFAYGVLESFYKENMTQEEGVKLAEKCIDVAIQKDSASGNGVNIFVIDSTGVRKVLTKRVNTHLQ